MIVSLLVAMARNRVIGKDNDLPWYLSADLNRFKKLTTGKSVIMGRTTFEAIVARIGKPLPNRINIILTRNASYQAPEGCIVVTSLDDALAKASGKELFVIGGGQVFDQALDKADLIYLTQVEADIQGDVLFPEIGPEWKVVSSEAHEADDKNEYPYTFITLERA